MRRAAFFDELVKLGAISDAAAQKSIDRLDALEKSKPTAGQVGRYGVLGAGAGALGKAVSSSIEHGARPSLRALGGAAAAGAIGLGGVPLVRSALDRRAEVGHLKKYMAQEHIGEYAPSPAPATHAPPFESGGKIATFMQLLKIAAIGARTMLPTTGGGVPSMAAPRAPSNFAQLSDPSATMGSLNWHMYAPTVAGQSGVNMAGGGGGALAEGARTVPPPRAAFRAPATPAPAAGALGGGMRAHVPFKGPEAFAATMHPPAGFAQGMGTAGKLLRPAGLAKKVVGGLAHA